MRAPEPVFTPADIKGFLFLAVALGFILIVEILRAGNGAPVAIAITLNVVTILLCPAVLCLYRRAKRRTR